MHQREWVDTLFRDHAKELHRYLRRFPLSEEDAYDLVQDVFVKLMHMKPSDLRQPKTWLFTVARNQVINKLKRKRNWTENPDIEGLVDNSPGPLSRMLENEQQEILWQAFSKLPARDQEMMSLYLEHEFRHSQIARVLGKSEISVRVAMHRSRNQLKRWVRLMEGQNLEAYQKGRECVPEQGS